MRKIKVLFITNDLGLGGVQRLVADFTKFIDRDKFEPAVATLLKYPGSDFYKSEFGNDIPIKEFKFRGFWDITEFYRLYRYLRQNRYDVVFTQLFMADTLGRLAAFLARVPVIVTEIQNLIPTLPFRYRFIDGILGRVSAVCISPTPTITDYAVNVVGFPKEKVVEIPTNAVDSRKFEGVVDKLAVRERLGVPADAFMVIHAGRLVEQKGQETILKVADDLKRQGRSDVYFVIVGSGRLDAELRAKAAELNVTDRVIFTGERKDVPDLLRSSDVFLFPSKWEGQGLILFEAIFSKIPIIASNVGGIPDVIKNEETGLLCEAGDMACFAKAIIRVLDDKGLADKFRGEAWRRFSGRTMQNTMRQLENLFENLLRRKDVL